MAPQVGLDPTTLRLTAGCSAIELLRSGRRTAPGSASVLDFARHECPAAAKSSFILYPFLPRGSKQRTVSRRGRRTESFSVGFPFPDSHLRVRIGGYARFLPPEVSRPTPAPERYSRSRCHPVPVGERSRAWRRCRRRCAPPVRHPGRRRR